MGYGCPVHMDRFRRILALVALLAVICVTTGAAKLLHERIEHAAASILADAHAGHHHPGGDHSRPLPAGHTDFHHACLTCAMLSALSGNGLTPPSGAVVLVLDPPRPATRSAGGICLPSVPFIADAAPRGPPVA